VIGLPSTVPQTCCGRPKQPCWQCSRRSLRGLARPGPRVVRTRRSQEGPFHLFCEPERPVAASKSHGARLSKLSPVPPQRGFLFQNAVPPPWAASSMSTGFGHAEWIICAVLPGRLASLERQGSHLPRDHNALLSPAVARCLTCYRSCGCRTTVGESSTWL